MKKLLLTLLTLVTLTAIGDDRLGFATHFDQGQPLTLMPVITPTGSAYIRDDINWDNIEHSGRGGYGLYSSKIQWINTAHAAGLKIVADVQAGGAMSSRYYVNQFDPSGYANACAWLATSGYCDVIEVLNEPNNGFTSYENSIGRGAYVYQDYATLISTTTAAVHAANPNIPVIGCGFQGQQILACLNAGAKCDGIVFHPYDLGNNIPETTYEWQYRDFTQFITAIRSWTSLPLWTTEQNISTGNEFDEAVWDARRLLLAYGLKVEHTFLYDFCDNGPQGVVYTNGTPRLTYYVIKDRLTPTLTGMESLGAVVTVTSHDAHWNAPDFKGYVFDTIVIANGSHHPNVAAVWFGNHSTTSARPTPSVATLQFPGQWTPHTYGKSTVLDLITGNVMTILEPYIANPNNAPQWVTAHGPIKNITVSDTPILVIIK